MTTASQDTAKARIEREKQADKIKHDRLMDRARLRDTKKINKDSRPMAMGESDEPTSNKSARARLDAALRDRGHKVEKPKKGKGSYTRKDKHGKLDEISAQTAKSAWLKRKAQAAKVSGRNHEILATKARKNKERFGYKEELPEAKSAQDPDIKDREGTQPAAYHKGLKKTTKAKRDAHFKKHGPKADNDASAYKDAPGDKTARKKDMPKSKYTKYVDKMMDEEKDSGFAAKSKRSGISVSTLRKVYNRGVAAWKTGHRPGTTPQQWGHARVNAFIAKKKKGGLNHDKDLA